MVAFLNQNLNRRTECGDSQWNLHVFRPSTRAGFVQIILLRILGILLFLYEIIDNMTALKDFESIYKNYYRKAFLFTKSYVHNELIAEDITSESLLRLWEEIRRQEIRHPDAFLLKILKNKALDHLKHETIRINAHDVITNNYFEELTLRISLLEACDPEEIFSAELQEIIEKTLSEYPDQTRHIFEMSRFQNMSNKEIAEELNLSPKTIEYHITKALKGLRISLKDYLPLFYFFFFFH